MSLPRLLTLLCALCAWQSPCLAQADSLLQSLQQVPVKYITEADKKFDTYTHRITNKTEKTLVKLARWEEKIKQLLEKASPETAQRLFNNNQLSFAKALEQYKKGESIAGKQKATYNEYRDKLTTSIKYLNDSATAKYLDPKLLAAAEKAKVKMKDYEQEQDEVDAMEKFIKERKKQLLDQSLQYIGNSKYLQKINKEAYYYVETMRNYKAIFSDQEKAEATALAILNKIPAFQKFTQNNSMMATLFGSPAGTAPNLAGLQTRASVNALIQNQIAAGGPNAADQVRQQMQAAQAELSKLKDRVMASPNGDSELPDFKPNHTKTQTFKQRLEFGNNFQFAKNNTYLPATADLALSLGYKLNDKSVVGIGASYKMGYGRIDRLSISHQGIGMRSFIDWKLKKQFFVSGGFEMNYNAQFRNIEQLQAYSNWQQSGLVGLTKKIAVKTKLIKGTSVQLLYDMLYKQHQPYSQPVLFRTGYKF